MIIEGGIIMELVKDLTKDECSLQFDYKNNCSIVPMILFF